MNKKEEREMGRRGEREKRIFHCSFNIYHFPLISFFSFNENVKLFFQ